MLQHPNATGQTATFNTGSPNYIDVSAGSALENWSTFSARATSDSWEDGDLVGIYIEKDASNWKVWLVSWDATNSYLELVSEEDTAGTISDTDAVEVTAVPTRLVMESVMRDAEFVAETGTTRTLGASDNGKTIRCSNGSAVAITLGDALPVGFHCLIVQEGAGTVTVDSEGTDTLNGVATGTGVEVSGQYKSAYVYQASEGVWVMVA
jgi:hypothetical protein